MNSGIANHSTCPMWFSDAVHLLPFPIDIVNMDPPKTPKSKTLHLASKAVTSTPFSTYTSLVSKRSHEKPSDRNSRSTYFARSEDFSDLRGRKFLAVSVLLYEKRSSNGW